MCVYICSLVGNFVQRALGLTCVWCVSPFTHFFNCKLNDDHVLIYPNWRWCYIPRAQLGLFVCYTNNIDGISYGILGRMRTLTKYHDLHNYSVLFTLVYRSWQYTSVRTDVFTLYGLYNTQQCRIVNGFDGPVIIVVISYRSSKYR